MAHRIFLHGSRRALASMPEAAELLKKIVELATGGLQISQPLFEEFRLLAPAVLPDDAVSVASGVRIDADLALSLGGDGSFLRTAQWVADSGVPILGVNAGHLGFLADMSPAELLLLQPEQLDSLRFEPRMVLKISSSCPLPDDCRLFALNDVALLKTDSASMIAVESEINSKPLTTYQADGLVVATPTGSTGYNLSVGGPIIEPTADIILLSPVAPHLLAMRPLAVCGNSKIELTVRSRSGQFMLSLDGRSRPMPAGTKITIEPADFKIIVSQRPSHHFAATLRTKLLWGERPVNQ